MRIATSRTSWRGMASGSASRSPTTAARLENGLRFTAVLSAAARPPVPGIGFSCVSWAWIISPGLPSNNRFLGSHEGFFAPFEFDATDYLRPDGENDLLVEVQNDLSALGGEDWGIPEDGDKIYAATGPGWDDPLVGWHHCPPGAGIYNRVLLEERSSLFVHSLFVRPNIDERTIEAWIEVNNTQSANLPFQLDLSIYPRNFEGHARTVISCPVQPAGPGLNSYRFVLPMPNFKLWSPQEPWLYILRASISYDGQTRDQKDVSFGMRKFYMDETREPKGTLYLNNSPIILRGANEMGHLQLCVMRRYWISSSRTS